jgi:hypothetical protein
MRGREGRMKEGRVERRGSKEKGRETGKQREG